MITTDPAASALSTFLSAISSDQRLKALDRTRLGILAAKYGTSVTTTSEDLETLGIIQRLFSKVKNRT